MIILVTPMFQPHSVNFFRVTKYILNVYSIWYCDIIIYLYMLL